MGKIHGLSTGYLQNSMAKSRIKGQIVEKKYSGMKFLQTPGRTPASRLLLKGALVPTPSSG